MAKKEYLSHELLDVLCCPEDKANLIYDREKQTLTCVSCGKVYPIKKGIPILLPEK